MNVKVTDPKFAEILESMLRSMEFVVSVERIEEAYALASEEKMMLLMQ